MAIDPEPANDESVEVVGEEVGQPEGRRLVVGHLGEGGSAGEELVAMGAGQTLDTLLLENAIEQPARAAVGLGDEYLVEAVRSATPDPVADRARDPAGPVVEIRRQAGDLDVREVGGQGDELAAEGSAADHEDARGGDPALHRLGLSHLRPRHVVRR